MSRYDEMMAAVDANVPAVEAAALKINAAREERWQKAKREWEACKVHTHCSLRAHLNDADAREDTKGYNEATATYCREERAKYLHCPSCKSRKLWPVKNHWGESFWDMCESCGVPIWSAFLASVPRLQALPHKVLDGMPGRDNGIASMQCYDLVIEVQPWSYVWAQTSGWGEDAHRLLGLKAVQTRRAQLRLPPLTEQEATPDSEPAIELYTNGKLTAEQAIIRTQALIGELRALSAPT